MSIEKHPNVIKNCKQCGNEFSVPYKQRYLIFCSPACAYKGRKTRFNQINLKCDNCGRAFSRAPSLLKSHNQDHEHFFCSKKCHSFYLRQHGKGSKNPNWKGGIYSEKHRASHGKGNRLYRIGKYYEDRARKELEAKGYYVIRSGGSKGIWDLVAIGPSDTILVQVKARTGARPGERELMKKFKCSPGTKKEYWRYLVQGKKDVVCYE